MKKILNWLKSPKSDIFLFIIAVVLLNLVASRAFFRIDLTAPRSYSLSRYSIETVKNLEDPLSVKVFFSDNLPAPYNSVETYVRDLLSEYKNKANKNFSYEFYDMSKEENEGIARDYDLRQYPIEEYDKNGVELKQVWMGMAMNYADRIEKIDGISSAFGLEYKITTTISKMVATAATLSGLKGDVELNLYISRELNNSGIQGYTQIEDLTKNAYEKLNKNNMGKIKFYVSSPSQEEIPSLVEKYGLQGLRYKDADGSGKMAAIGLVLSKGDDFRLIPLRMVSTFFGNMIAGLNELDANLEESLKSLVSKTVEIGYITGHGEQSITEEDSPYSSLNLANAISDMYTFRELNLAEEEIPPSIHTVLLNGPKEQLADKELYKIDQFIMKGGSLMVCQAPFTEIPSQNNNTFVPQNLFVPRNSGIEELLEKYGVKIEQKYVFDENCHEQPNQQFGQMLRYYFAPLVQRENLASHAISENLGDVLFIQNGALTLTGDNNDAKATVLAKSSKKSWTQSENIIFNPLYMGPPLDSTKEKSENLAVILEGKFESAFDEEVKDSDSAAIEENEKNTITISNHLKKSVQKGKIFVTASELMTTAQVIPQSGMSTTSIFLRNAIDYLSGNEDFCKMRTKGLSLNSLKESTDAKKNLAKIINQCGLVLLVAICGLIIWRRRASHKRRIRMQYNPNDERIIEKGEQKK